MEYRPKQGILKRGNSNDSKAPKEMFSTLSYQRNANQSNTEIPPNTSQIG